MLAVILGEGPEGIPKLLAYADNIVLLTHSWSGLQKLLTAFEQHISNTDMACNTNKTVCMMFAPRNKAKIMNVTFLQFRLGGCSLQYVQVFKYLGHIITDTLCDDFDMQHEIHNLFTKTNILTCRLAFYSFDVKIALFKAYCISLYDARLWKRYKVTSFNELSSCHSKCLKLSSGIYVETVLCKFYLTWGYQASVLSFIIVKPLLAQPGVIVQMQK